MKYLFSVLVSLLSLVTSISAQDMGADEILKQVETMLTLNNSAIEFEMQVYRSNELRNTYRINLKFRDWDCLLAETLYPPRNKGEKSLHVDGDMWLYLPKVNKVMRVSESNSFSNSDFSNMDVLDPRLSKDYTPVLVGVEPSEGGDAYKLELTAQTEDVPYAKILYWIRKSDLYPLRQEFYTFSGNLLKQLVYQTKANVRNGLPDTFIMTTVLEKDKYSVMRYLSVTTGQTFPPEIFRKDTLAKR